MTKDDLLVEKERLIQILDEKKRLYDRVREEEQEKLEIRSIKNAIKIKDNQIKGKSVGEWERRGKNFSNWVMRNPLMSFFLFSSIIMLLQGEWFAMAGCIAMAFIIPEYLKWQKLKQKEKKENVSEQRS